MDNRSRTGIRIVKRIIYGILYAVILFGISYAVYYKIESRPTCLDGKQNQGEEGLDCGLVCGVSCIKIAPLKITNIHVVLAKDGDYDVVATVFNPNSEFGSPQIDYDVVFKNASGKMVSKQEVRSYILPGQTRYFLISFIKSSEQIISADIIVKNAMWERVSQFDSSDVSFPVKNKNLRKNEFEAVLVNDSDFDFNTIDIGVVIYGENNNILAINKTNVNTIFSREERYFKVSWPEEIINASKVDVEITTNLLENSNFIKRYGTQEKFQEYYQDR